MTEPELTPATAHLLGGHQLRYWDSGPVPNSDNFATVVVIHGLTFNAYGFLHLLPLVHKQNLRLVIVQRREYEGSSRYSDQEMKLLAEKPGTFLEGIGAWVMRFVHYLVVNTQMCKPTKDHTEGGISVLGWSLGGIFAMSMFSEQGMADREVYASIEPYVTKLIFYDPPHVTLGLPISDMSGVPDKLDTESIGPIFDPENFHLWVTCYFDQPFEWDGSFSKLDRRSFTEHATFNSWSEAERERFIEKFPLRSDFPLVVEPFQTYVKKLADSVLHGTDPGSRAFPRARVAHICCQRSTWSVIFALYATRNKRQELLDKGLESSLRPIDFKVIEWGNHFVHSDYPEEFVKILSEITKSQGQI